MPRSIEKEVEYKRPSTPIEDKTIDEQPPKTQKDSEDEEKMSQMQCAIDSVKINEQDGERIRQASQSS